MATNKAGGEYANGVKELEEIVMSLESDETDLETAMESVERGLALAQKLKKYLETAENKVQILKKKYQLDIDTNEE